jgi:hypothetical protein
MVRRGARASSAGLGVMVAAGVSIPLGIVGVVVAGQDDSTGQATLSPTPTPTWRSRSSRLLRRPTVRRDADALTSSIRGMADTVETYKLALERQPLRASLLERARSLLDNPMEAWDTAAIRPM